MIPRPLLTIVCAAAVSLPLNPMLAASTDNNPLLVPSTLPLQYPRFDLIKDEHFLPAYTRSMELELQEIEAIAQNPAAPTFENTLVAFEKAGQLRAHVDRIFSNLVGTHSNDEMRRIEKQVAPLLAAQKDTIRMNAALFRRIEDLYERRNQLNLGPEDSYLLERTYKDFIRAGAKLSAEGKSELKKINAEIATLQTTFSQNVLNETNKSALLVESRDELKGLTDAEIQAAAQAAKAEGHEGKFLLRLMNTSSQPPLASLENRATRERLLEASLTRGSKGGPHDNREIVRKLAELRAKRAQLLGYANHAAFHLEEQTARTVEAVNRMLRQLAPAAVSNARAEAAELQSLVDAAGGGFQLSAADWPFYAEKLRRSRFNFDEAELRPYLEANRVLRDGVFFSATRLFGITFHERKDLPLYHPDVQVFEVREANGDLLGIFIFDLYARPSKRGGAWMNSYVPQARLFDRRPVVANHLNVPKPPAGEPTLMTFDEVNTLFHEFGHALHGLFSNVTYPKFAGTSVPRDFVEFPSQVYEMWATWPEVLQNYARHYKTGEAIPQALVDRVLAAEKFNQGYATTEYLAAALLDQAWHQLSPEQIPADALALEAEALRRAGMDFAPVPPRYRSTYFSHVFSLAYSAGYYSYIWSEVLDAASVDWFKQRGGLTRENGEHMRKTLLSRGGSADAMEIFRSFYGRDPEIAPLLRRRGLEKSRGAGE
jgi:peptidyl-dipeptidase Dcp